jgi:hypothetical protein
MLIPPHILLAVDDQHGSSVALLHGVEYEIALSGQHMEEAYPGLVAAFVPIADGNCDNALWRLNRRDAELHGAAASSNGLCTLCESHVRSKPNRDFRVPRARDGECELCTTSSTF